MKIIITENQFKKLMSVLNEADISSKTPESDGLKQLAGIYNTSVGTIMNMFSPEGIQNLLKNLDNNQNKSTTNNMIVSTPVTVDFKNPLGNDKYRITSKFGEIRDGRTHKGIDIAAPKGTPIYSPENGTIDAVRNAGGRCGGFVQINHGNIITKYCHLSGWPNNMKVGDTVSKGQIIGYVGSTGRSTGPHLHYEILNNKLAINPQQAQFGIS